MKEENLNKYGKEMFKATNNIIEKMLEENKNNVQIIDVMAIVTSSFLLNIKVLYENIKSHGITWDKFSKDIQASIKMYLERGEED